MDDYIFIAAGDLYRDNSIKRNAKYINDEHLAQIEPQLDDLGSLHADKHVGSKYNEHGAESKLLEEATKKGADYVLLKSSYCQEFTFIDLLDEFVAISSGRIYKLKRAKTKNEIEVISATQHPTFVPESFTHDSTALDYAKKLLAGNAGGTVMDWKKQ